MSGLKTLHPHQLEIMDALKWAIHDGSTRPMVQAPTGAGKTVLAAHIVAGAMAKGKRVAFCVPSISLVDQTFERFVENGIDPADMGIIQADHPWKRPSAPIQIATAQSLARRDRPQSDVVVIDEGHVLHQVYQDWIDERPEVYFIGLSATPWAKGLGKRFDKLVKTTSTQLLIDSGFLSPFRVFAPSHPDLTGVKTLAGDYHEGQLGEAMSKPELVGDIVTTWLARGEGKPTLCFCVNRAHAGKVADEFTKAGVPTAYIDANTPRLERDEIGKQLAAGAVKVVVNIGCLTTGIDWDVRCLILARPTKSEMLFVQIVGRALRTAAGKEFALILDHSDTHLRLGMVTDIDHDVMDDGRENGSDSEKKVRDIPLPKPCKQCQALVPATKDECPNCGAVVVRGSPIQTADGELTELGTPGKRGKDKPVSKIIADMGRPAVYAQLLGYAQEKGRKDGWVAHAFKEIFGTWPNKQNRFLEAEPSPLVRSWLRSRDIAYAKAREKKNVAALLELGRARDQNEQLSEAPTSVVQSWIRNGVRSHAE